APTADINASPAIWRVQGALSEIWDDPAAPEMVVIPAGSYTMGSPDGEAGRFADEGPRHRVTFKQAFALGKYPVTRDEYAAFVRETGRGDRGGCAAAPQPSDGKSWKVDPTRNWRNPGFVQTGSDPVVCV